MPLRFRGVSDQLYDKLDAWIDEIEPASIRGSVRKAAEAYEAHVSAIIYGGVRRKSLNPPSPSCPICQWPMELHDEEDECFTSVGTKSTPTTT